ncbi:hypothetical protein ACCO45_013264 [Purpureocillium lilacinum]|uniref:Uncharacterized protein n=1 Tax=Purpureocillium lilacinum TaxID=33203 RepID=A0ACC4DCY0_PURLI
MLLPASYCQSAQQRPLNDISTWFRRKIADRERAMATMPEFGHFPVTYTHERSRTLEIDQRCRQYAMTNFSCHKISRARVNCVPGTAKTDGGAAWHTGGTDKDAAEHITVLYYTWDPNTGGDVPFTTCHIPRYELPAATNKGNYGFQNGASKTGAGSETTNWRRPPQSISEWHQSRPNGMAREAPRPQSTRASMNSRRGQRTIRILMDAVLAMAFGDRSPTDDLCDGGTLRP